MAKRTMRTILSLASVLLATTAGAQGLFESGLPVAKATVSSVLLPARPEDKKTAAAEGFIAFAEPASAFLLDGEDDVAHFTFHLSGAQAAAGGKLRLAYQNAVSVLPDTSAMDVEVNGKEAGGFAIRSPNGFLEEGLSIPSTLLKPGRNVVRLRARQHHRVDCSLDATYELWTRLDPAKTGFATPKAESFSDFDSLLSIGTNADGRTDLRLVVPASLAPDMLEEALPTLQALVLFLNRQNIDISVADRPGSGPGIDLFVSLDRDGGTLLSRNGLAAAPRGLSVNSGAEPDRAAVVLRASGSADIKSTLLAAVKGDMRDGLSAGVLGRQQGTIVAEAGTRYKLKDAGYESRVFAGRLSRTEFNLEMPADFYPAEYATVDLYLNAATSPGLKQTAQLLVRVNDLVVKSYPFRDREGEQFKDKKIELPLRAFRPGFNKVELLAELPKTKDDACLPEERDDATPRFILLDDTAIEVPQLARVARLPDLAALAGKAYPFGGGAPFDLVIDRADPQSAGAALSLVARLALAARAPLTADVSFGKPSGTVGRNVLFVTAENDFTELGAASKRAFPSTSDDAGLLVASLAMPDPLVTAAVSDQVMVEGGEADDLLAAFQQSTAAEQSELSLGSRFEALFIAATQSFARWLNYEDSFHLAPVKASSDALVRLSQSRSPDGSATWTVVSAGSPRDLEAGARRLIEPGIWSGLQGGAATIETASLVLVNEPAASRYVAAVTDRSPGNLRRLAAAWFSDNFQVYVVAILALLGFFAVWLGRTVRRKGVRSDR